jgi:hypothetical protein
MDMGFSSLKVFCGFLAFCRSNPMTDFPLTCAQFIGTSAENFRVNDKSLFLGWISRTRVGEPLGLLGRFFWKIALDYG